MKMTKIEKAEKALKAARLRLNRAEVAYNTAVTLASNKVETVIRGETTTLTFGSKVFKIKRARHGRMNVYKDGKMFRREYFGSMRELRADIAEGTLRKFVF
jgi:hypothetical protein